MNNEKEPNDGTNGNKERQKNDRETGRKFVAKPPRSHQGTPESRPPWTGTTARMVGGDAAKQY